MQAIIELCFSVTCDTDSSTENRITLIKVTGSGNYKNAWMQQISWAINSDIFNARGKQDHAQIHDHGKTPFILGEMYQQWEAQSCGQRGHEVT